MWRAPCRYIWAAAITDAQEDRALEYWADIVRIDTEAADACVLRYRKPGWAVAEPTFVPRRDDQPPGSPDGVLIVLLQSAHGESR
eukprot:gene10983-14117_t